MTTTPVRLQKPYIANKTFTSENGNMYFEGQRYTFPEYGKVPRNEERFFRYVYVYTVANEFRASTSNTLWKKGEAVYLFEYDQLTELEKMNLAEGYTYTRPAAGGGFKGVVQSLFKPKDPMDELNGYCVTRGDVARALSIILDDKEDYSKGFCKDTVVVEATPTEEKVNIPEIYPTKNSEYAQAWAAYADHGGMWD